MATKNSRVPSKSSHEPTFSFIFRILLLVAIIQFLAAALIIAPRFVSTVANQIASKPKTTEPPLITKLALSLPDHEENLIPAQETIAPEKVSSLKSKVPPSINEAGIQPGASLGIIDIQHVNGNDGEQILKIAIKSRPHTAISVPDVKVQVYFYDQQENEIVASKSQVASRWLSSPVDWKDAKPELLEVTYHPDINNLEAHYMGYIVAVYYQGELQGYRADPVKLTKQFPVKIYSGGGL